MAFYVSKPPIRREGGLRPKDLHPIFSKPPIRREGQVNTEMPDALLSKPPIRREGFPLADICRA